MATSITYKGSELASFSNNTKTLKTAGKYLEGDITITHVLNTQAKTVTINNAGTTTITPNSGYEGLSEVEVNVPSAEIYADSITQLPNMSVDPDGIVYANLYNLDDYKVRCDSAGYVNSGVVASIHCESIGSLQLPTQGATTVIPSETAQTLSVNQKYMTGNVTVAAITPTYVGSGITTRSSLTVSGPTVTAAAGYYASDVSTTIANATLRTINLNFTGRSITINSNGLITSSSLNAGGSQYQIASNGGYVNESSTITILATMPTSTLQLPTQASTTITPTTATQTITGQKYMTGDITVQPIPSEYVVPTGTLTITAAGITDVTNYAAVTVPEGAFYGQVAIPFDFTDKTSTVQWAVNSTTGLVEVSQEGNGLLAPIYSSGYFSTSDSVYVYHGFLDTYQLPTLPAQSFTPSSSTQTVASTGKYMLGDITVEPIPSEYVVPSGTLTIEDDGIINVANYSNIEVPAATPYAYVNLDYGNEYMNMDVEPNGRVAVSFYTTDFDVQVDDPGWVSSSTYNMLISAYQDYQLPTLPAQTITPSESTQTINSTSKWMTGNVTVNPITSTYVGSGVTTNPTITVSGPSVTIPAGYYDSQQTKTIANGSVSTPSTTITANPTVSVSNSGLITASVTGSSNVAPSVSAGYITSGTAGTVSVTGSTTLQLTTQSATTVTPSTSTQTVNVTGKYMTGNVTVNPIPSNYIIPSGSISITSNTTSIDVSQYATANVNVQPNLTTTVVTATSTTQTITPPSGYVGFSTVTVNAITLVTYYTGITTPTSNFGNNGDIYLVTD